MNAVNILGGGLFIAFGLIGLFRPQWMVRVRGNKNDMWLNSDFAPIRRIVCAGTIAAGLIIALKGLTSSSR